MAGMQEFVGRYCGRGVTNPLLTLHPRLDILFRTNLALQAQGFNAHYIFLHEESVRPTLTVAAGSGTCGGLVDGPGGSLVSPGFPRAFPGDLSCTWLLRARPHYHVYLRVHQLQLQGSIANCRRAKLAIHDGYRPLERQRDSLMSFCGDLHYYRNQADREVLSQWNRLVVTFRTSQPSDNTTKFAGFHLLWTEVLLTTQANCSSRRGFWCSRSTYCVGVTMGGRCITTANFCIHPSLVCDTQPNCSAGDHSDEADCGGTVAVAVPAGTCGALAAVVGLALLWLTWRRRRSSLTSACTSSTLVPSSCTSDTLLTSPTVFATTLASSVSGPDLGVEVNFLESSMPTPPPPPFLASSLLTQNPPLPYSHKSLSAQEQPLLSSLLSLSPLRSPLHAPCSNSSPDVSPQLSSPPPLTCHLSSPPSTPTPPPPPLLEPRDSSWVMSFHIISSASPKHDVTALDETTQSSAPNDTSAAIFSAANSIEPPVSTFDSGSSGYHVSSLPNNILPMPAASTVQNTRQSPLLETAIIPSVLHYDNEHNTLMPYRPTCSRHRHCSHCPHFTEPISYCHHHRKPYGHVRSHSLPRHCTVARPDWSGRDTLHVSHPWPLTPKVTRRASCIGSCGDEDGRESPEEPVCLPCVSPPTRRVVRAGRAMLHHHHSRVGWPASHWYPHVVHYCRSRGHCCYKNHFPK
ncbi:uncharacterized protein [Panulirus ornatus]